MALEAISFVFYSEWKPFPKCCERRWSFWNYLFEKWCNWWESFCI